ncbi:LETM1 family protein [Megaselia abdita]
MNALIRNHKNILKNTTGSLYRKSTPSYRPYSQNHLQIYKKPNNVYFKRYAYHPAVTAGLFHHDYRHISTTRALHDQQASKPSSKVEQTVQTMKNKQKEQAEQVLKQEITEILDPKPAATKAAVAVPVKKSLKTRIWEELVHYYHGFRLLFIDINISRKLIWRVLNGNKLTRRENRLLLRTTSDLFRLVPFSLFIIIPFMELLLPVFIKFFPGMLPSTFQTSNEREDKLKASLQVKLEVAKFLQKTLDEMAVQHKGDNKSEEAKQFSEFFKKIKDPDHYVTNDEIIKFSKRFEDEITLDSLHREQLIALCKILEIQTFATTNILRFQLHMKLRSLAADDHVIHREGVDSLDVMELQQACKSRGMRAYGMTPNKMRQQLQQWIDLSLNEKVPPTLLLLSRALMVSDEIPTSEQLKETIRSLPDSLGAQTKAAIGELEGKIDNKTKIEVIKDEERKIKEELEEQKVVEKEKKAKEEILVDKAKVIGDAPIITPAPAEPVVLTKAETDEASSISSKDAELIGEALESVSKDKNTLLVEKETIKELKEEIEEYKEDVEELREVRALSKEKVGESRAAKILFKKVNTMIDQLDKVLNEFEKKKEQTLSAGPEGSEAAPVIKEDLVKIEDLVNAVKKLKTTSDESRLKTIENVLSKIDVDRDGHVKVDDVLKVIEAIGRDNVKLNQTQIDELIDILGKEEIIEAEDKIEKAIAKSLKEFTKNEELIDKAPIITDSGKEFKAEPMAPPEPVFKDNAPTTSSSTEVSSKIPPTIPSNAKKATKDKSI